MCNHMVTINRQRSAAVFKAIADPTRREILRLLRAKPRTVGDVAANFRISRPAVSKHLRLLRLAGLVVIRKHGTTRCCQLNGQPLRVINEWLRDYEMFWDEKLRGLKQFVEKNE